MLASGDNGTLYVGVTSDLARRIGQHREGTFAGFTNHRGVKRRSIGNSPRRWRPPSGARKR
ncbi:GIY-YIG nuclease family protein [Sphingomonas hankookensis]